MMMRTWQKAAVAGVAGVAAFGAGALLRPSVGDGAAGDDVVAPIVHARNVQVSTANASANAVQPSSSRLESEVAFNPFGPLNAGAPAALGQPKVAEAAPKKAKPASAPVPPPPPPPMAPPLPFVAMGSISGEDVTGNQPIAFLQQQDRLLIVRAGESVGGNWRVEAITPQRIEFVYLPLMQRQSLPLAP